MLANAVKPLVALSIAGLALAALLTTKLDQRSQVTALFFDELLEHSHRVDLDIVASDETSIGRGRFDDHAVALRLGDALVRWQIAKRAVEDSVELRATTQQLLLWLEQTDLRGAGLEWVEQLRADERSLDPVGQQLRSLRRSLPDDVVEAGRWLAALRLWPQSRRAELTVDRRKAAFEVLDAAQLMGIAHPRLPELLTRPVLEAADLRELADLATETLLVGIGIMQ